MTAPNAHIKVSGTWKQVNKMHVKVSGTWKQVNNAYVRVGGAWKKFLQSIVANSLGGDLSVSSSVVSPTSGDVPVTIGAGNSGKITLTPTFTGSGTPQYRINAGSYSSFAAGATPTFTAGQTITVRGLSMTSGTEIDFVVTDFDTGTLIGSYTITRT